MRTRRLNILLGLGFLAFPVLAAGQEIESSDHIRVLDQADRGEMVFLIGPVDLPAGLSHDGHVHGARVPLQVLELPRAGWIHGFVTDMVDSTGAPLEETFLHHVNVIDPGKRELFSPISQRIMAAGPETGEKELPPSMGLPVEEGQRLLVRAVFHNPTTADRRRLYLRIRFAFTRSQAGEARAGVFPLYLDVKPPVGKKSFDLPSGVSSQSWEGRPAVSGRLLAAAGHMHRHGRTLRLEDVTAGKVLWEVEPEIDAEGGILDIPIGSFWKKGGLPIRSDHVYRLTVTYDNPTGATIPDGGMGTLGGVFIPDPGEKWPDVDPAHRDYLADLRHTRGLDEDMVAGREMSGAPGSHADHSGTHETDPARTGGRGAGAGDAAPGAARSGSPEAGVDHEGHGPR